MAKARWPVAVRDRGTNRSLDDDDSHALSSYMLLISIVLSKFSQLRLNTTKYTYHRKQRRFSRPNFYSLGLGLKIYGLGLEGHGQGFESCIDNLLNHRQTRGPTTTAIVKLKVCLGQSVAMTDWTVCIEMKLNDNSFLNPTNVTCFTYLP